MRRKDYLVSSPYLTVKEAAAQLGITPSAVHHAIVHDKLPYERIGWQYLIPKSAVDKYEPRAYRGRKRQQEEEAE